MYLKTMVAIGLGLFVLFFLSLLLFPLAFTSTWLLSTIVTLFASQAMGDHPMWWRRIVVAFTLPVILALFALNSVLYVGEVLWIRSRTFNPYNNWSADPWRDLLTEKQWRDEERNDASERFLDVADTTLDCLEIVFYGEPK